MFDTSELSKRILMMFGSLKAFSKAVHNSEEYIYQYIEGKKILNQRTIENWASALDIPAIEYDRYFFKKAACI